MAPRLRSYSRKRPRSVSSRSSLDAPSSPRHPSALKLVAHKKRKLNRSGKANVALPVTTRVTRATSLYEQARSSTTTDTDETISPNAEWPSSRTSPSIGAHDDIDESDANFEDSEVSEVSESEEQPPTDSDNGFEATAMRTAKRVAAANPNLRAKKRVVSSKLTNRTAAFMAKSRPQKQSKPNPDGSRQAKKAPKTRNKDSWTYKTGIKDEYPPIYHIGEMFDDMVQNANISTSIDETMRYIKDDLKGRNLRVATMCSGTESPILALELIASALAKHGHTLKVEHLFSAEIVPFKQAYIERNFSPPLIFRDVLDFKKKSDGKTLYQQQKAKTVYGSEVDIPKDVDLLVAGFSCVDFSNLNNKRKDLDDAGESGSTFTGIYQYSEALRPRMIVLENVLNAPWERIKQVWAEIGYAAEFVKLDTKDYYIPHTRLRGYMLCIDQYQTSRPKENVQEWKELMKNLKRPASSSIEAFLLPENDPRVHRGRVEMVKGSRGEEKPPREVNWTKCQGRHLDYRSDLALGNNRPMTAWEDNGSCKMPDYSWGDWGRTQVERIWDTLEINLLRSARRGFDCQYKTRVWDLSQNIDRFTDTTSFGITGCITPSGLPYVTSRGGPMIGLEALAMQGLPIEKLLLTRETQKQLQDLAGNAMTTTTVGAAILAALIAGHQLLRPRKQKISDIDVAATSEISSLKISCDESKLKTSPLDVTEISSTRVPVLLANAKRSNRLCLCEGPANLTQTRLQLCEDCGHTTCVKCGGNPKHRYVTMLDKDVKHRLSPVLFENELKAALPMKVTITKLSAEAYQKLIKSHSSRIGDMGWGREINSSTQILFMSTLKRALGEELRFHSVVRGQTWTAYYDSRNSSLELHLTPYYAEWRLFLKPESCKYTSRLRPEDRELQKVLAQPFARMRLGQHSLLDGHWQTRLPCTYRFTLKVEGKEILKPAWESVLGLQGPAFAEKKVWSTLAVSIEPETLSHLDEDISGDYQSLMDCGKASGSLHKRIAPGTGAPMFLFLDPTRLGNPKNDKFVFSRDIRRLEFGQTRYVVAAITPSWRPNSLRGPESVECEVNGQWVTCPEAALKPALSTRQGFCAIPPENYDVSFGHATCDTANAVLSCKVSVSNSRDIHSSQGEWITVSKVDERSFLASLAWLIENVRKVVALSDWKVLSIPKDYKRCQRCAPDPPVLKWRIKTNKQGDKFIPFEDPQQAAPYERALKDRPSPFVIRARIDEEGFQHLKFALNVSSLIHRALSNLGIPEAYTTPSVAWRLRADFVASAQPSFLPFRLLDNKSDIPAQQPPSFKKELRPEQLRSLGWMIEQESDTVEPYEEEEVEEALLPQLGWIAEASAKKNIIVRGGVLADQVGYGKTVTMLGLIDSQRNNSRMPTSRKGSISIKATLIVVPGHLVSQWEEEANLFLENGTYKIFVVKSEASLSTKTIEDFIKADIIIVSWNVLTGPTYLDNLAHFAAVPDQYNATGRAFNAWYAYAVQRISTHVDVLQEEGPKKLVSTLSTSHAEATVADDVNTTYVPSRRLRGKEYVNDVNARLKAFEVDREETKCPPKESAKKVKTNKGSKDPFALKSAKSWKEVRRPLFQLFHFQRLVVDEYTYVAGANHVCVIGLQADKRWVLSGTPPMGDFADIKTISRFLKVNLGIDDGSVGVIKASNIKEMEKDRTEVEKFRSFQEIHSSDWHQHRHDVAQRFLNRFVRQNIADVSEIRCEERIRPIELPAAERAIYLELHSHLMAQDMKIRKGRTKYEGDREKRMYQTLGDSNGPEEALLKRCSHFDLGNDGQQVNAKQVCNHVVKQRQDQLQNLRTDLMQKLMQAIALKEECGEEDKHYVGWTENARSNAFGDQEVTEELKGAIDFLTERYRKHQKKVSIKSLRGTSETKKEETPVSTKSPSKKPQGPSKITKYQKSKPKAKSYVDDRDFTSEERSETKEDPATLSQTLLQKVQTLRELTAQLRHLSIELVGRMRSLRFFRAVQEVQKHIFDQLAGVGGTCSAVCCRCSKRIGLPELSILTICGHKACHDCLQEVKGRGVCVIDGCKAAAWDSHIVNASELGGSDNQDGNARLYGKKLREVIRLIKGIGKEDQVLLFVQFEDLLDTVGKALKDHGVDHFLVKTSNSTADESIHCFQSDKSHNKKKVLVLNMAKESASGANLTNANHIIFLSPVLTDHQYGYDSSKTQAIGRARRYGQQKTVFIYHFLALNTIDVDILQAREHKKLMLHGNEAKLVDRNCTVSVNGITVLAKDLPDYGGRLPKNHWLFNDDY